MGEIEVRLNSLQNTPEQLEMIMIIVLIPMVRAQILE